jgi:hypothetical protein
MDNINFEISEDSPSTKPNVESTPQSDFDKKIKAYFSNNKVRLYILTPCFNGLCYSTYVQSLMNTLILFNNLNIELRIKFCKNDSLVSRARNNLIAEAMFDEESTHFMFIDNDITWSPVDILKLIMDDKDIIGGVYPLKHYNWDNLLLPIENSNFINEIKKRKESSQLKDVMSDLDYLKHNMLKYNINHLNNVLNVTENVAKVKHVATGFMLIKRNVIEKMIKAFPSTKYNDDIGYLSQEQNKYAYALFDCGVEDNHYMSEDWLFCHRWTKMGGDIYINISINLLHTGIEEYNGCYMSTLI